MFFLWLIVLVFVVMFSVKGFKVVQQAEVMIIERLGKFKEILGPGLHFIVPVIENDGLLMASSNAEDILGEPVVNVTGRLSDIKSNVAFVQKMKN